MKRIKKGIKYFVILLSVLFYISCEEIDSEKVWGESKIYMPQASLKNGGNTNEYPVPSNGGIDNFILDTVANTIEIPLGVYRSGLEALNSFSVSVAADMDETARIVSSQAISQAVVLPDDVFSLPAEVTVPDGKRDAIFHLTIDRKKLIANYPNFYKRKLVVVVGISNPSNYELNESLCKTTVIINGADFMPVPPVVNLLKGGDMEAASASFWTASVPGVLQWGYKEDYYPIGGKGGCLRLYDASAPKNSGCYIYQKVNLVAGQKYQLTANVKVPAGAYSYFFVLRVSEIEPPNANWDKNNTFVGCSLWSGTVATTISGDIRQVGTTGGGLYGNGRASGTNGIFTASSSTMYITINPGLVNGSFNGSILIDEVLLTKVEDN